MTHTETERDPLAAMVDELAIAEVHAGFPDEREKLARRMLFEAVTPADVALLARHCAATVEGSAAAARVLASILLAPDKREARLADLRGIEALRAMREAKKSRAPGDAPYVPGPTEGEPREVWDHDRQCRMASCRVNGDRRTHAEVAAEMGVSLTTIAAMVARGEVLSASPLLATGGAKPMTLREAAQSDKDAASRLAEFRDNMRRDSQVRRSKQGAKGLADWNLIEREQGKLLASIRTTGMVDLAATCRNPTARGALAELEFGGQVLRAGPPDDRQMQPYVLARDDAQRHEFKERFLAWARQDAAKPRTTRGEAQA